MLDANIVISALLKDSKTRELLLYPGLELYASDYLFEELEEHRREITGKARITVEEFDVFTNALRKVINALLERTYSNYFQDAR